MGLLAAEPVTVELVKSKCLPSLYYGLEAWSLSSADFKSLEYVVVGTFMKIFNTKSKEVATSWMEMFNFPLPSVCISNRQSNFLRKLSISDNIVCRLCAEYQALCCPVVFDLSCNGLFRFFFFVLFAFLLLLPLMANKVVCV